ncbi:MAG TPA: glycosyl hydrolase family 28 protein [Pseudonocardiaceae bacterium]|jgi:polygalacturonase
MRVLVLLAAIIAAGVAFSGSAQGATLATGDSRLVSRPTVPAVCATVTSTLPTPASRTFSSTQEATPPDTSRIQTALNSCLATGKAVVLAAAGSDTAFLSGPLKVGGGETLLVSPGVTLFASSNAAQYQVAGKPTCGTVQSSDGGCVSFITVNGSNAAILGTTTGSGTQGRIDGRGDITLHGGTESWYQLALDAKNNGGDQNNSTLITASANSFTLYDVDLLNSPFFHVAFRDADGFTAWGVRIDTPDTAKNTDGIDTFGAADVTVTDSFISDGDDCVAIKASAPSRNITISNDHCYGTHGLSIGSETNGGLTNVLMTDDTVQGTDSSGTRSSDDNGIRIKSDSSRGGTVNQITYVNTCLTGIKRLLDFDPFYTTATGTKIPSYTDIVVNGVKSVSSVSGTSVLDGHDSTHPLGLTLENVSLDATATTAQHATIGVFDIDLAPTGTGVTVSSVSGSGSVPTCVFPAFPAL